MPLSPLRRLPIFDRYWWTPIRTDAAFALCLFVLQAMLLGLGPTGWSDDIRAWGPVWALVGLIPVVIRRKWLWVGIFITTAFMIASAFDTIIWTSQGLAVWVMAYTVAAQETWARALAGTLMLWVPTQLTFVYTYYQGYLGDPAEPTTVNMPAGLIFNAISMVVLFLIGRVVRARREVTAALAERAAAAEANQHAHAEQAVADERRRIARELHDVVAHHVSVIGVMATGARRTLHRDPQAADEALTTIEQTSRTTLRELRRLLFVLRAESETDLQFQPQPGLTGVRALVDQVTDAGLPTSLKIEGELVELDPGVQLTAYRIVQEALTNSLKHAGVATAVIRLCFEPRQVTIEVYDTGRGPAAGYSNGHGLVGMRERVAVYGGSLRTGPRPGGGFRVHARIPVEQAEITATEASA